MDLKEIIVTIISGILALSVFGFGFFYLVKYGLQEAKETKELRAIAKKALVKYLNEDK